MSWISIGRYKHGIGHGEDSIGEWKHKIHDSEEVELLPFRRAVTEGHRIKKISSRSFGEVGVCLYDLAPFFYRVHRDQSIMKSKGLTLNEFKPLVTQVLSGRSDLVPETFYDNYLVQSVRDKMDKMCTDICNKFTAPVKGWEAAQERFTADQALLVASVPEMKLGSKLERKQRKVSYADYDTDEERGTKRKRHVGQTKTKPAVAVAQVHHQLFVAVAAPQQPAPAVAVPHAQVQSQVHH